MHEQRLGRRHVGTGQPTVGEPALSTVPAVVFTVTAGRPHAQKPELRQRFDHPRRPLDADAGPYHSKAAIGRGSGLCPQGAAALEDLHGHGLCPYGSGLRDLSVGRGRIEGALIAEVLDLLKWELQSAEAS
jgi:hypothetical protein